MRIRISSLFHFLRNVGKALIRSFRLFFILAPSFYIAYFYHSFSPFVSSLKLFHVKQFREGRVQMFHVKHSLYVFDFL